MNKYLVNDYKFLVSLNKKEMENVIYGAGVDKIETDLSELWLINPNVEKISPYELEKIDNKSFHAWEIPGIWAVLIRDKVTSSYRAISSINNEFHWYFHPDNPNVISNVLVHFADLTGMNRPDYTSIASYLCLDWSLGGYTIIDDVHSNYGGSILYISNKSIVEYSVDLKNWLVFDNSIEDRGLLVDRLVELCKYSLENENVQIALTAGKDSRSLLAAALKTKIPFKTITGTAATVDRRDVRLSKLISDKLGIEHLSINASKKSSPPSEEIFQRFVIELNSMSIPRNWILFYKEFVLGPSNTTRLMGYGGEFYSGFYDNVITNIKRKLNPLETEYFFKVIERANKKLGEFNMISERNGADLFYQRERDNFWVGGNVRAMLPYMKIYQPLKDPTLVRLGYRFKGGIRATNLQREMIATLPDNVKNIPINYNYFLSIIHKLKNRLIHKSVDYNYMLRPEEFQTKFNYDFFSQVINEKKLFSLIESYKKSGKNDTLLHKILAIQYFFKETKFL